MLIALLFSCTSQESPQSAEGFISLHPSVTETFYALGAEDLLKGRSDYCKRPETVASLPSFGTSITPNFEGLASANVKNIVGDNAISQHEDALSQLGTVHALPWLSLEDMQQSIKQLGVMTNTTSVADRIVQELTTTFQTQPNGEAVLLLLSGSMISKGQLWYIKPESIHGAMLEASGYQNAVSAEKSIPQMGIEELLALDPPVIAILGDSSTSVSELESRRDEVKTLTSLQAVAQNKICIVTLDNAFGTGPSIVQTVPRLKDQLSGCLQ